MRIRTIAAVIALGGTLTVGATQLALAAGQSTGSVSTKSTSVTAVAAAAYKQSDGDYYFVSPSGRLHCGLGSKVGCQSSAVVANLPQCKSPASFAPIVTIKGSAVTTDCTTQGIFIPENAKVLNYGQSLTVGQYTCTSQTTGVTCKHNPSGAKSFASVEFFGATK